jgi:hypothetical protein
MGKRMGCTLSSAHDHASERLRLASEAGELAFLSTTTMFGTPVEITLAELVVESFFPAGAATAEAMRRLGSAASPHT